MSSEDVSAARVLRVHCAADAPANKMPDWLSPVQLPLTGCSCPTDAAAEAGQADDALLRHHQPIRDLGPAQGAVRRLWLHLALHWLLHGQWLLKGGVE